MCTCDLCVKTAEAAAEVECEGKIAVAFGVQPEGGFVSHIARTCGEKFGQIQQLLGCKPLDFVVGPLYRRFERRQELVNNFILLVGDFRRGITIFWERRQPEIRLHGRVQIQKKEEAQLLDLTRLCTGRRLPQHAVG